VIPSEKTMSFGQKYTSSAGQFCASSHRLFAEPQGGRWRSARMEAGLLLFTYKGHHPFLATPLRLKDHTMAPLGILSSGLQVLSSWLMSVLALLALFVSVIICLVFLELFFERGEFSGAYTVKSKFPKAPSQRSQ